MHIHIKRKHIGRNPELAPKIGSSSFPNSVQQPSFYAYKTLNHSDTIADEIKNTEAIFDKHLENICRINEANRSINEFRQNSTANSSFNEIAKSLIFQRASNLFQGRRSGSSMTPKKEILPTGYQISFCDTCLSGCNLRPVLYPIEFEVVAKLVHKCDPKNLFTGQNGEEILEKKRQLKDSLGNGLSEVTSSRIGQKEAYLKGAKLSQHAFSEETRIRCRLPPNRSLIEERDCIKINSSRDTQNIGHWFYRIIREYDKGNNVKITQSELMEFPRIARSTFGVFQVDTMDPAKKYYLLIYLVL